MNTSRSAKGWLQELRDSYLRIVEEHRRRPDEAHFSHKAQILKEIMTLVNENAIISPAQQGGVAFLIAESGDSKLGVGKPEYSLRIATLATLINSFR